MVEGGIFCPLLFHSLWYFRTLLLLSPSSLSSERWLLSSFMCFSPLGEDCHLKSSIILSPLKLVMLVRCALFLAIFITSGRLALFSDSFRSALPSSVAPLFLLSKYFQTAFHHRKACDKAQDMRNCSLKFGDYFSISLLT